MGFIACARTMSNPEFHQLYRLNFEAKALLLRLHFEAKSGHVGSALSCAEILSFIRFHCWQPHDTLVLSKGHAASALYSVLAVAGDVSETDLMAQYYKDGTHFSAHPPPNKLPGIPFATGSLGHGASLATGLALGARLRAHEGETLPTVFCVLSDGELNEGSTWEAFAFAAHHKLSNLTFFLDHNKLQGFGRTDEVLNMEPLTSKLLAFGLSVTSAKGHNFSSLDQGYQEVTVAADRDAKPSLVIAETIKGRGLPKIADTVDCHYLPMTAEMYEQVLNFCEAETNQLLSEETKEGEPCEWNSRERS